ncbi:phosphatidylinositol 3-kinase VPS34 [Coccomyxa sp. Obi]|nr:phosphatidylinositol 3-kinase VPS34 [Coccomyxa sp. Obi]
MVQDRAKAEAFVFYLSCDISSQVHVRVDHLVGHLLDNSNPKLGKGAQSSGDRGAPALYVIGQLCAFGEVLGLPTRAPIAQARPDGCSWGSVLSFPLKYCDLAQDAQLALTVWQIREGEVQTPLGGATLRLFSKKGRLKSGQQELRLWPGREADMTWPPATPAKLPVAQRGEQGRLEQLMKRYNRGEITPVEWLDHLTLQRIQQLRSQDEKEVQDGRLVLQVELPTFPHAVVYQQAATAPATPADLPGTASDRSGPNLQVISDPEVNRENPSELKAAKLARSMARGVEDRDLKPNTKERQQIEAVIVAPPNRPLTPEERALVWRFRWSLTGEPRALTKVLRCVDWGDAREARSAGDLIARWAPIGLADALELLSPAFSNPEVRAHAVEVLKRTENEELLYYLLQLVQALRYEAADDSRLAAFLVQRAISDPTLAIFLHWYLYVEWEDPAFGPRAAAVHKRLQEGLTSSEEASHSMAAISAQMGLVAQLRHIANELKGTAAKKAEQLRRMVGEYGQCGELAYLKCPLPLDPGVLLTGILSEECSVFKSALAPLRLTFRTAGSGTNQGTQEVPGPDAGAMVLPPPSEGTSGTLMRAPSAALKEGRYQVIYKKGDDLRQDQLVVQIFSLMDRLLKRENLDLRLTPYRVLPTSAEDGLIECVPSMALARVIAEHKSIHRYWALYNADPSGPYGVKAEVLDTFVKSCAGYCVMTYILGVGDRHLDNLMLTPDGRLFHIDFGFIMGRDPKPWPPPFKLSREMVEAMGGAESELYRAFCAHACEAYNILRKSASLILSLFHLMAGAAIPDIRSDPEKAMLKLQEKLRLGEDDEVAIEWMQQLIHDSSSNAMAGFMEATHRIAQALR